MTVQEFIDLLKVYNPKAKVKFFTSSEDEIFLLSDYPNSSIAIGEDEENAKICYIDMGN